VTIYYPETGNQRVYVGGGSARYALYVFDSKTMVTMVSRIYFLGNHPQVQTYGVRVAL
jgi:hypothetical protein